MQTLILGTSVTPTPPFKPQNACHPLELSLARAGEHFHTCRKLQSNFHFGFTRTGICIYPQIVQERKCYVLSYPRGGKKTPGHTHLSGYRVTKDENINKYHVKNKNASLGAQLKINF